MDAVKNDILFVPIKPYGFKFAGKIYKYKYAMLVSYNNHLKSGCGSYDNSEICRIESYNNDHDAPYLIMSNKKDVLKDFIDDINNDKYYSSYGRYQYDDDDIFVLDENGVNAVEDAYSYDTDWNWGFRYI